jgi:PAS domain S-box-containing protein
MTGRSIRPRGRLAALRDLLWISLAVVALLWLGSATDTLSPVYAWISDRLAGRVDVALVTLTLTGLGLAIFALKQFRVGRQESAARLEAEDRFQDLVEKVPAVIYTWDPRRPAGTAPTPYVSPQVEQILGFTVEEWTADPQLWIRQIHPDDRQRVLEASAHADRTGEPFAVEYRHHRKDGSVIWVLDEARAIEHDAHGRPTLVQGIMYDISERKRAEANLAEAEARYRTLIERVPAVTYTWDATYRSGEAPAPYISPQIEALLGFPAEAFQDPMLWTRLVHPDDLDRVMAAWDASLDSGGAFRSEYRMRTFDDRRVWVQDEAVPVSRDDEGHALYQGVMFDITDRKLAEDRLLEAEERFRSLVEQIPAITYIEEPGTGRYRYVSPQVETVLGYPPEAWLADPDLWKRTLHPDDRERVIAEDQGSTGDEWSSGYRAIARDGRVVWLHNHARLLRDPDGNPRYWQGVAFDITELKAAESRIAEAEDSYRTLVEQLPVVVYRDAIDDLSTALYISPQYERLFGYPPEARTADPGFWVDHLHPEDRGRVLELSRWTNETGEPFSTEYRFLASDGRVVWVRDEAELLRDADGNPMLWQGVLIDVTARKHAEDALARRDAVLEAIGFAAERFLKSRDWAAVLPEVLERLGAAASARRVCVFENETLEDGRLAMALRHEWLAPGVPSIGDRASRPVPYADGFGRWQTVLSAGRELHGLTRDLPDDERPRLQGQQVLSQIVIPVFIGHEWWGFLAFDDCAAERVWPLAEADALKTAADTLGAAIGRSRAEHQRVEAETRYRRLVEAIPAVTYIQDAGVDGRITYVSPQVERMLGYTPAEWTGGPTWLESLHPEDRDRVLAADEESERTGQPFRVEYRLRRRDDTWIWVHDEAVLILDEQSGRPLFWQGLRFDITDRKHAEQQLREAEERFRTLVENLPAATYIDLVDELSTTLYVSPQIESIWGYTPLEWAADPNVWIDALHPEDRDRVLLAARRHNEQGEPFEVEYRFRAKDGRWTWVSDHATVVRDEDARIAFSQGVMFDVTERRQAEEQLRETEQRYRAIVEHIPAAVYVDRPDASMQTVYVSPQIEQIMGCTPERYVAEPELWLELMPDQRLRDQVLESYMRALEERRPWTGEYLIRRPDGREVWVHDETAFVFDDQGEPLFLQGVIYDVTERKLAEDALAQSERREREAAERLRSLDEMKNTFLAAVSHELRSPLTAILGLALTLDTQQLGEEERGDLLGRLAANARKLDGLLKDLLDIDRLSRGIVTPKVRPTDVAAIVDRTVQSLDVIGERSVVVQTDPIVVPVDPPKIERIVENLVMNAVRHTPPEATVWVRTWPEANGAVIAVEDDGPGVPKRLKQEIFEPFRQGPTASPHSPGTGIGLSLVAMFADLHGGRAWVEDREGGGASFRVFLPATPAHPQEGDEAPNGEVKAAPKPRRAAKGQRRPRRTKRTTLAE